MFASSEHDRICFYFFITFSVFFCFFLFVVICLERGADLHVAQLMPLPLTISCFSKIQIGFCLSGTGLPG